MQKYYPEGDKDSSFNVYGYITAQLLVKVLQQCGDDLTRDNVLKQATHLTNVDLDMFLPGISVTTTPTDYRVNKQFQMARFNGERWERYGSIITDAAKE
jgi:branched-chain amino acid transport system substrate-binding protein